MEAALAVQKGLRARLTGTPAVTDLVPAGAILDRNQRPAPSPSIVLGEAQVVDEGASIARKRLRIYHTAHVWKREPSLAGVTAIMGALRRAVLSGRLDLDAPWHCIDAVVADMRAMRDPDGETSHGVVTLDVQVHEVTP